LAELDWAVEGFLDFFLAWDFVDFFFLVLVVGAVELEVSGAMVCPVPIVWAYVSMGKVDPATNASNATAEISAFMRGLLGETIMRRSFRARKERNVTVPRISSGYEPLDYNITFSANTV
jgi:hypothetical protein